MSRKKNRSKRKRARFFKVVLVSISVFMLLGFGVLYAFNILNNLDRVEIPTGDSELGIKENAIEKEDVINIALFGLDQEESENGSRADSIMIASLDKIHKKIKLTSIMRDTYVDIPNHGKDKINHSYSFGGPELALRTINQNFDMNIKEFVTIDFFGLEKIIDALDGITVDVKPNEVPFVNMGVREANRIYGDTGDPITEDGTQLLDGRQAVSYSRIRKTGDGDFERTERQRFVLEQVIHKGLDSGLTKYPSLLNAATPFIKTSLNFGEMLSLGSFVYTSGIEDIEKYRLPVNGYFFEDKIDGVFYLIPNTLEENSEALKSFIYDDIKTESKN